MLNQKDQFIKNWSLRAQFLQLMKADIKSKLVLRFKSSDYILRSSKYTS